MKTYTFEQVTTKTGDSGTSSTYDGTRLYKNDITFDTLGDMDEFSSWIGKLRHIKSGVWGWDKMMELIQEWMQMGGSLVATDPRMDTSGQPTNPLYLSIKTISPALVELVEQWMTKMIREHVKIENGFILPGSRSPGEADIDIARAVCRRAERSVVRFMVQNVHRYDLINLSKLLNRLSDFLFILGRFYAQKC